MHAHFRAYCSLNHLQKYAFIGAFACYCWLATILLQASNNNTPAAFASALEYEENLALPFYTRTNFSVKKIYVAKNQSGASNRNNGLYPTYRGGRNGPVKDFNASVIQDLQNTDGFQILIRAGTYPISGNGLNIWCQGSEAKPCIISGYSNEKVILEGNNVTEIVVRLNGRYTILEKLTIQNGVRYNIQVAGDYTIIRNNTLRGSAMDSLKTVLGAEYGLIMNNDISGQDNNGIDQFAGDNWLIKDNVFHHGHAGGRGILLKGGVQNSVVSGNVIHDYPTTTKGAISLGGFSDEDVGESDTYGNFVPEALNVVVVGNEIYNYAGPAIEIAACHDCIVEDNTIRNTAGGFLISLGQHVFTEGTWISNNTLANITSGGIFRIEDGAEAGLESGWNTYSSNKPLRFDVGALILDHPGFQALLRTDTTSRIVPNN